MHFDLNFANLADFVRTYQNEIKKGGVLVRTKGEMPERHALVEIRFTVASSAEQAVTLKAVGTVVQQFAGTGFAVMFSKPEELAPLQTLAESMATSEAKTETSKSSQTKNYGGDSAKPAGADKSAPEKIHKALHGTRDERAAILRDTNRTLHLYVLRNPGLGLDEVSAMARMTTVSMEVLKQISERREWISKPDVALALARNPTTPIPIAVRAVDFVSPADLKQLAKDGRTREPVQRAARKKVLG